MITPTTLARLVSLEVASLTDLLGELAAILQREPNDRELDQVLNAMEGTSELSQQFNLHQLTPASSH